MKKHFRSLFDPDHLRLTISLFTAAVLLMIVSQIVGITDNLPGITILLTGIILLYFSILHPWRKVEYYAILIGACVGILILEWLGIHLLVRMKLEKYVSEAIGMIVAFFICLPGIVAGIIGTLICAFRKKIYYREPVRGN
jgi:hypothetical protein